MVRAALETGFFILGIAAALFVSAGRLDWLMAWVFVFVYAAFSVVSLAILSPALLVERTTRPPEILPADLLLSSVFFILLYPATLIACGLDARFGGSPKIPTTVQCFALLVFLMGYSFTLWAMHSNIFFSSFVRIQRERGHHVIDTGPYAYVRHPGYAGAVVAHLALPVALGSLFGLIPTACGISLLIRRIALEEQKLAEELEGYRAYTHRVRWRLVPCFW